MEILKVLKDLGSFIQINSTHELEIAEKSGFTSAEISMTTTNLSDSDLKILAEKGIQINFDSIEEIERYSKIKKGSGEIGIRIALGQLDVSNNSTNQPHSSKSRIGIQARDFDKCKKLCEKYGLKIIGVHGYGASNVMDLDVFKKIAMVLVSEAKEFPDLKYVNFGGGFGIPKNDNEPDFDWESYGKFLSTEMTKLSDFFGRPIELKIEPGRSIVASAGIFLAEVTNIKHFDKWTEVGVNAGFGVFPRPFIYGSESGGYHEVSVLGKSGNSHLYTICGNSTLQKDFLAEDRLLPKIEIGDILVFHNAGAYCATMMSLFPGMKKPAEEMI
jgi:diaminopimelate decarboxylase